jgi:uncharacterized membrane protein YadS
LGRVNWHGISLHQLASVTDTARALPIAASVTSHVPTLLRVLIVNAVFLVTMETQSMVENAFVSMKLSLKIPLFFEMLLEGTLNHTGDFTFTQFTCYHRGRVHFII